MILTSRSQWAVACAVITTLVVSSGCAIAPTPAPAPVPPTVTPRTVESEPATPGVATADRAAVTLPAIAACPGDASSADAEDPRCPEAVVLAAAMSWLGKTTAVYDGTSVEIIEHDPAAVRAEAEADDGFRRLLAEADAAPRDGLLDGGEARHVEQRVLEMIDARYAANAER